MSDYTEIAEELRKLRDEMKLQMHLASKDAEVEWGDLMNKWDKFASSAQLEKSQEEVGEAAKKLGIELKKAFDRFRQSS